MKNLENYGVQEMNAEEMSATEGGFLQFLIMAAVIIGAIILENAMNKHPENVEIYFDGKKQN